MRRPRSAPNFRVVGGLTSPLLPLLPCPVEKKEGWWAGWVDATASGIGAGSAWLRVGRPPRRPLTRREKGERRGAGEWTRCACRQTAARVFERRFFWYGRSAGLCRFGDARERLQARAVAWPQSPEASRPGCPGDRRGGRGGQVEPAAPGMFRPPRIGRTQCQARRACSSVLARAVRVPLGSVGKALGTGVTSVWSSCGDLRGRPLPESSRAASMSGPDGTPVTLWRCPRARAISRTLGCPNRRQGGTVARCCTPHPADVTASQATPSRGHPRGCGEQRGGDGQLAACHGHGDVPEVDPGCHRSVGARTGGRLSDFRRLHVSRSWRS